MLVPLVETEQAENITLVVDPLEKKFQSHHCLHICLNIVLHLFQFGSVYFATNGKIVSTSILPDILI